MLFIDQIYRLFHCLTGLSQDVVATDAQLNKLVPKEMLSFRAAAQEAIDADREQAVVAKWVDGSIACRNFHPEHSFYAKRAGHERSTEISADALWQTLRCFGYRGDFLTRDPCRLRPHCCRPISSCSAAPLAPSSNVVR